MPQIAGTAPSAAATSSLVREPIAIDLPLIEPREAPLPAPEKNGVSKGPAFRTPTIAQLQPFDVPVTIGIVGMHLMALAAPFTFTWSGLVVFAVLWWLSLDLGICLCYHRLLTHRSFRTYRWMEYLLTFFALLSWQGSPATWVGTHRIHHKHSDGEEDPHTPHHGFNWAHATWMLRKPKPGFDPRGAAKDLLRDPTFRFMDRWHAVPCLILGALLYAAGQTFYSAGVSWVVWGLGLRVTLGYHATWLVNSASHTWGYQSNDSGDDSKNNWWVAILAWGEGWHNNHHAQQRSAAHGWRWWEYDPTYWTILAMERVGLAWDVVRPKLNSGPDTHEHVSN